MNADELLGAVAALPTAVDARAGNDVDAATLVAGMEVARTSASDERRFRRAWKARQGGGARPLLLVTDDPDEPSVMRVLGPRDGSGPVRTVGEFGDEWEVTAANVSADLIRTGPDGNLEQVNVSVPSWDPHLHRKLEGSQEREDT
jgi:hypothetical protein